MSRPLTFRWQGRAVDLELEIRAPHAAVTHEGRRIEAVFRRDGDWIELRRGAAATRCAAIAGSRGVWVSHEGRAYHLERVHREAPARTGPAAAEVRAPMTGRIVSVSARAGNASREGELLVTMEAMKMEFRLTAPEDGAILEVACEPGDRVELGQLLVRLAPPGEAEPR